MASGRQGERRKEEPVYRHALCVYPFRKETGPRDRIYPPLGLETVAASLEPYCRSIDVIDLRRESAGAKDFVRPDTDLICFSVNWRLERESVREEILSVPHGIRTVIGGLCASMAAERWLSDCPNVDIVVRQEGHDVLRELAQGRPLDKIAGISYRVNGRPVHNPGREPGPLPDDFHPDRRLRRYAYSLDWPHIKTGLTFDTVASSLGCPYNCTFCAFNRDSSGGRRRWSPRSPESVVGELAEIDAKVVAFLDLEFTHDLDRVEAICDLIISRGLRKVYVTNARLEIARRPDLLRKMKRAGFAALLLGVESAQDKTLRAMKKGFTTRQAREYFRVLRQSGMLLHGTFIFGFFGETEAEMRRIVPFARELGVDTLNLCLFRSQGSSDLEELVDRNPGYHVAPGGDIYSDRYSLSHLTRLRNRMFRSFYSSGQMYRIVRKSIKNGMLTPRTLGYLAMYMVRAVAGRFDPGRIRPFTVESPPAEGVEFNPTLQWW